MCIVCRKKQELLIKTGEWIHNGMESRLRLLGGISERASSFGRLLPNHKEKPINQRAISSDRGVYSSLQLPSSPPRRKSFSLPNRPFQLKELKRQFSQEAPKMSESLQETRSRSGLNKTRLFCDKDMPSERILPSISNCAYSTPQRLMPEIPIDNSKLRTKPIVEPDHQPLGVEVETTLTTGRRLSGGSKDFSRFGDKTNDWTLSSGGIKSADCISHFSSPFKQMAVSQTRIKDNFSGNGINVPSDIVKNRSHSSQPTYVSQDYHKKPPSFETDSYITGNDKRFRARKIDINRSKAGKITNAIRNDSMSSDQSENVHSSPPKPHKLRTKGKKLEHQLSLSSSEEDIRSTPEFSTEEDPESLGERYKCQRNLKREEILDAKIKKFLAVNIILLIQLTHFYFKINI